MPRLQFAVSCGPYIVHGSQVVWWLRVIHGKDLKSPIS